MLEPAERLGDRFFLSSALFADGFGPIHQKILPDAPTLFLHSVIRQPAPSYPSSPFSVQILAESVGLLARRHLVYIWLDED